MGGRRRLRFQSDWRAVLRTGPSARSPLAAETTTLALREKQKPKALSRRGHSPRCPQCARDRAKRRRHQGRHVCHLASSAPRQCSIVQARIRAIPPAAKNAPEAIASTRCRDRERMRSRLALTSAMSRFTTMIPTPRTIMHAPLIRSGARAAPSARARTNVAAHTNPTKRRIPPRRQRRRCEVTGGLAAAGSFAGLAEAAVGAGQFGELGIVPPRCP